MTFRHILLSGVACTLALPAHAVCDPDQFGSSGDDVIECDGTITGSVRGFSGDDDLSLVGTSTNPVSITESLIGDTGADNLTAVNFDIGDSVTGGAGNDTITLDSGAVGISVFGGGGDDVITLTDVEIGEFIQGNDGNDTITASGSTVGDDVDAGSGDDALVFTNSVVDGTLGANTGNDSVTLTATTVGASVFLGSGDDVLIARDARVGTFVLGGAGDDAISLTGGSVGEDVVGGNGDDMLTISGTSVTGSISGGAGDDTLDVADATVGETIALGEGDNRLDLSNSQLTGLLIAGGGQDIVDISGTMTRVGGITLGGGDDSLTIADAAVDNAISLGAGNDLLDAVGLSVGDTVFANGGNDQINLQDVTIAGAVLLGEGDDALTMTSGTLGLLSAGDDASLIAADGDDTVTLTGVDVAGYVSLGGGDDTLVLGGDTNVSGVDIFGASVSGGAGDDVITVAGGFAGNIQGNAGDDRLVLQGGSISGFDLGEGADVLVINPSGSDADLDVSLFPTFTTDDPLDSLELIGVDASTNLPDALVFDNFALVSIAASEVTLDTARVGEFRLLDGARLVQTDGLATIDGFAGSTTGRLVLGEGAVIDFQDGATDDRLRVATFVPAGGSLLIDVDASQRGYQAENSDFVFNVPGSVHATTGSAGVGVALTSEQISLSGAVPVVDDVTLTSNQTDPGIDARPAPSSRYILLDDPSTLARTFWLEDEGEGGVLLKWTTPLNDTTLFAFLGGGSTVGNVADGTLSVDAEDGAGALALAAAAPLRRTLDALTRETPHDRLVACEGQAAHVWASGSANGGSFGDADVESYGGSIGADYGFGSMADGCAKIRVGVFAYLSSGEADLALDSATEFERYGGGAYVQAGLANATTLTVSAGLGGGNDEVENAVLQNDLEFDADTSFVSAAIVHHFAPDSSTPIGVSLSSLWIDTDGGSAQDSLGLSVDGREAEILEVAAMVRPEFHISENVTGFIGGGGVYTDVESELEIEGREFEVGDDLLRAAVEGGARVGLGDLSTAFFKGYGLFGDGSEYGGQIGLGVRF